MATDPILKGNNIAPPDSPAAAREIGAVMLKVAGKLRPEVKTISFANNNFNSTGPLSTLCNFLPKLENLSFENNRLRTYKDLDTITPRGGRVSVFKELILTGNPLREIAVADGRLEDYRCQVARRFPLLVTLDQQPVPKISFDVPLDATFNTAPAPPASEPVKPFPASMGPGVFGGDVNTVVAEFLTRYFTLFDTDRRALLPVYAENATFSFSANTSYAPRSRLRNASAALGPNQRNLSWDSWINNGSRNLNRIINFDKMTTTLQATAADVVALFEKLPKTRHDISEAEKFVVDAWPISGVLVGEGDQSIALYIGVHGQFTEVPAEGISSFDRTFLLALATEGSTAQQAGWPVVVLSDQLVVRAYSPPDAWAPGPMTVAAPNMKPPPTDKSQNNAPSAAGPSAPAPVPVPIPQPAAAPLAVIPNAQTAALDPLLVNIPELQRSQVLHVKARTGLNTPFALQCLQGNEWNTDRAIANFEAVKATIPAEAFL